MEKIRIPWTNRKGNFRKEEARVLGEERLVSSI